MNKPRHDSRATSLKFIKKRGWIIALVITAFGFLMRLPGIFEWWLNPDEGIYYSMVTWENTALFWEEMLNNAHPPLFYLVIRAFSLFTTGFVAIRWVSLVFGSIAIFAVWLAGREIVSSEKTSDVTGLLAAVLVAVSPGAIAMSQLIRPYMMQLAFLLLAFYHLLRFRNQRRSTNLVWYSSFLSLALLTHYSSILALGVFGISILRDIATRGIERRALSGVLVAHVAPLAIAIALFVYHLRPYLLGSFLAEEALDGWLAPFMIGSIGDIWLHLLGFMGFLLGPRLAGPAVLVFLASLALAVRRRSWSLLALGLGAIGVAVAAATTGHYPFGACRHCSWLIGFVSIPLAWGLAQAMVSWRRGNVIVTAAIILLYVGGYRIGTLVGTTRTGVSTLNEQTLRKADVAKVKSLLDPDAGPETILISTQSYYLLVPYFSEEREDKEIATDGSFFTFQRGTRNVIVLRSWDFLVGREDIGKPNHLYTFVLNVDRQMPRLQLGKQNEVLMVFGGWSHETPKRLLLADQSLPPGAGLISKKNEAPGLTAFSFDIARYRLMMREALNRERR
jgi:hypothetical protein